MTLPRASRPALMWADSFSLVPLFPVRATRSDPARSTNRSLEEKPLLLLLLSNSSTDDTQTTIDI
uniref:Uncharacterized protein n=1 Tax=Gouania willdenowi TaxID=441366 RepID=A0A8C5HVR7_GOUWI